MNQFPHRPPAYVRLADRPTSSTGSGSLRMPKRISKALSAQINLVFARGQARLVRRKQASKSASEVAIQCRWLFFLNFSFFLNILLLRQQLGLVHGHEFVQAVPEGCVRDAVQAALVAIQSALPDRPPLDFGGDLVPFHAQIVPVRP